MAKIAGSTIDNQDGTFTVARTHDVQSYMEKAAALRSMGATTMGDSWHIASIPSFMIYRWAKEAGVDVNDNEAIKEVMMKKLMSGDVSKFRVHQGNV